MSTHGLANGRAADTGDFPHAQVTEQIIGAAFMVERTLGSGFNEVVYVNAMAVELQHRGLRVARNVAHEVIYRGVSVGRYIADFVVEGGVIVEAKVARSIEQVHRDQLLNYLRVSELEVGLVVNFGQSVTFKRVVNSRTGARHRRVENADNGENSNP
jgi:GxxExxY protein